MVPCTDNGVDGGLRSTTAISLFIRMQFTRDCARRPRPTESSLHVLDRANTSQRHRRETGMILLAQGCDVKGEISDQSKGPRSLPTPCGDRRLQKATVATCGMDLRRHVERSA